MKKILIAIMAITALSFSSCTKQLDQSPVTSKDLSKFLTTQTEVEEYVNGVYANLQFDGCYGLFMPAISEIPSDNSFDEVPANDDGIYGQLDQFTTIPSNIIVTTVWRHAYQAIQKTNVVLRRIGNVTYSSDAMKQSRVGEMKFIRALMYFNLVRLYGNVPLDTVETTNANATFGQGRTPTTDVYAQIVQDLTNAISVLPATTMQPGRIVKTAAQSLLGKVFLTLKNYTKAAEQLQAVVNSGRHQLLPNLANVFSINNKNNAEIIFDVQFASGINGNTEGSIMFQQFSPSGTVSGAKGHNLPTKSLYALYTGNDKRKTAYLGVTANGVPFSKKLTAPTNVITDGGSNVVVLRYADVLLMLSEAENEMGNTTMAAQYLDSVRLRAGVGATTATSQPDLRNAIALERRLELVSEGQRWFDLIRTGMAVSTMNAWFTTNNILITIDSTKTLMPVPQSQVDTDPSITQNPGY